MPDYKKGKIYSIRSHQTDEIYIGSTTQQLSKRMATHRAKYKRYLNKKSNYYSSFKLMKYEDAYIELICACPCNNRNELEREEGKHIRDKDCINKYIAGRSKKQYGIDNKEKIKLRRKQYYIDNREKVSLQTKQYRIDNKEQLKLKRKKYYENNKEKINNYHIQYRTENKEKMKLRDKDYYEKNKEKILLQKKEYQQKNKDKLNKKYNCECGGKYTHQTKARHFKTKKHIKYLENL